MSIVLSTLLLWSGKGGWTAERYYPHWTFCVSMFCILYLSLLMSNKRT